MIIEVEVFYNPIFHNTLNLIRLQSDNCMRFFALSLVENRLDFYERILNGEHIGNILDAEGNRMSDKYLSEKLDTLYPFYFSFCLLAKLMF